MWYPIAEAATYCVANSNGLAAGRTLDEAILSGLLEVVERDAVSIWWYNRLRRPAVDLSSFRGARLVDRHDALTRHGVDAWLLDITTDVGIPTFVAVGLDRADESIHLGSAAHPHAGAAAYSALGEMSQMWFWSRITPEAEGVRNLLHGLTLAESPFLAANGTIGAPADLDTTLSTCLEHLHALKLQTLAVDLTRTEIQVPVARVIVPELRHCWNRLGRGRLYDVPVSMGWLEQRLAESALNPRFCPI
jgi:ribosomal protein S12 methylthiotransferase accessory factor